MRLSARRPLRLAAGLAAAALLLAAPDRPWAQFWAAGPIIFSDELGGFRITSTKGTGTLEDPYVVVEEITNPEGAVLVVRGLGAWPTREATGALAGFVLRKVVTNRSGEDWSAFAMELQETLGKPSDQGDGLSFGQATATGRPFSSSRFTRVHEVIDVQDAVVFQDGVLRDGETAVFDVVVTDTTPRREFFLLQRREQPIALGVRRHFAQWDPQ